MQAISINPGGGEGNSGNVCTPGKDWWAGLLKSHSELVRQKPKKLPMVRARAANHSVDIPAQ